MPRNRLYALLGTFLFALIAAGCGGSSDNSADNDSDTDGDSDSSSCDAPSGSACYVVVFEGLWTQESHPDNFPSNAHFSPLIGLTHKTPDIMWAHDGSAIATDGIEVMAETGATGVLRAEIANYIDAGDALAEISASGIGATGSTSREFVVAETHSLVSLTSMLAPSPDWFVGVRNIDLRDNDGWIDSITLQLDRVYDSGTDNGPTFTSTNIDATPHLPIGLVSDEGNHFLTTPLPLATLTLTRVP
ncbi:MAG: spondin domain-containing protein [Pseudomonadota bacterium]